jgi:PAS domain-containing protein
MPSARVLSRLLETLYAAPCSPELWPEFLNQFAALLDVSAAGILYQDLERADYGFHATIGVDPASIGPYENYYGKMDAWRPRFLKTKEGEIALGDELSPPRELKRTEFYNDFLTKYDFRLYCAIPTLKRSTTIEFITLYQRLRDRPPGKKAIDTLELVLPHVQNALRLRRRLQAAEVRDGHYERALDLMEVGVILLDGTGTCIFANRAAHSIFGQKEGLLLKDRRLRVEAPNNSAELAKLLRSALHVRDDEFSRLSGAGMRISRKGRPLQFWVSAASPAVGAPMGAAAVAFVFDPDSSPVRNTEILRDLYQLTPAEARVAELLSRGHSLPGVAASTHVTYETARSQLKSVFSKTGARRQSELVRLISAVPVLRILSSKNQS